MDFSVTDEQIGLVEAVHDVLAAECPPALVRAIVEDGAPDDAVWRQAVELGWTGLAVPEPLGGLGMTEIELAMLFVELGRVVAPGPFLATLGQAIPAIVACASAEQAPRLLAPLLAGERTATLAVAEAGRWFDQPRCVAKPDGDGVRIDGVKTHVVDAGRVDDYLVTCAYEGGVGLVVVPADAVTVEPLVGLDVTRPLGTVTLSGVQVASAGVLGAAGTPTAAAAVDLTLATATTLLAAEMVGTAAAIIEMTTAYAKVREQFDVPIGSFQAVKHQLADGYVLLEKARAVVEFAAMTLAERDERHVLAAAMAKAAAGELQREVAGMAIQLHGGIGFTWEHDLHLLVKRLKGGDPLLGTAATQRQRIADLLDIARG